MLRAEVPLGARLLLLLALILLVRHLSWSIQTPVAPNSDRYDYLARAAHLLQGEGSRGLVEYPLRFAFGGATSLPAVDVVRPPLWPAMLSLAMSLRALERAGVIVAALCALAITLLLDRLARARFGALAGAGAALAFASSFATRRALWGGGPEVALALLLLALWAWAPVRAGGMPGHLACASLYGALPALHPTGWLFAALAALARPARYAARWLPWMLVVALAIGAPWYLRNALAYGVGGGALQAQAELAKSLHDPGGLGPYLGMEAQPGWQLLREATPQLLRLWLGRVRDLALGLDGWLSWPFVLLALWGWRADPALARRDFALLGGAAALLSLFSGETRLLLPLLPIAAVWVGAGVQELATRGLPWPAFGVLALLPWLLPLGASLRPGEELRTMPSDWRDPAPSLLEAILQAAPAGEPMFVDSSVVAWRSGRPSVFVPSDPASLEPLRAQPALQGISLLALGAGAKSRWVAAAAWQPWLASATPLHRSHGGALLLRLPARPEPPLPGPEHPIAADYVPSELIEIPVPPALRAGISLRRPCWERLQPLLAAADSAGVPLRIVSGYRTYEYQAQLFASAQERHGAAQGWVAAPGHSEHQLGEALDLADAALEHVLEPSFGECPAGRWLREHCAEFGFRISYTPERERETGIRAEPWHIRCVETH